MGRKQRALHCRHDRPHVVSYTRLPCSTPTFLFNPTYGVYTSPSRLYTLSPLYSPKEASLRCCSGAPASFSSLLFPHGINSSSFVSSLSSFLRREKPGCVVFPRPCILRLWVSPFRPNREMLASSTLKLRRAICARTCLAFASSQEEQQQRLVRARTSGIEASLLARRGRGYVFLSARDTPFEEAGCTQRCFS